VSQVKIVSVVAVKGGVGKTITSLGLADALAFKDGQRVLIIDGDQQASISRFIVPQSSQRLDELRAAKKTTADFVISAVQGRRMLAGSVAAGCGTIKPPEPRERGEIFLVAGSMALRELEKELYRLTRVPSGDLKPTIEIATLAKELRSQIIEYAQLKNIDTVIIDTQASFGILASIFALASDELLTPVVPDRMSFISLNEFGEVLAKELACDARKFLAFTKVQIGFNHSAFMDELREELPELRLPSDFQFLDRYILQRLAIALLHEHPSYSDSFEEKYGLAASNILSFKDEVKRRVLEI
jgi:cellulose biosynthesis protein BcsQ